MTIAQIAAALADATTVTQLVDLNDWAVNALRAACAAGCVRKGAGVASARELHVLVAQEAARVRREGICTLDEYIRCSRAGSAYRLNRRTKAALYTIIATRLALEPRLAAA